MNVRLSVLAVAVVAVAVAGAAAEREASPVHLAGLRVVGVGAGKNASELQAFRAQSGITLALVAQAPEGRKFVEVDDDLCELASFADDSGRNLLDGVDWDSFPRISADGRFALVEVSAKARPAPGAGKVLARGSIHARVARGTATARIDPLEPREGFEFEAHGQSLRVVKVSSEDGLAVVLQTSRSFAEDLKEVRFFGADGEPIEVWSRGSMTLGSATQLEFSLSETSESLGVELEMWQELETVKLAFELEAGVGLGG